MSKIRDVALRLLGGVDASDPQNSARMTFSQGSRGTELYSLLTGDPSNGITLNEKGAMSVSAVYACVGLIGGAVAAMPLHIYERTDAGRQRYTSPLWWFFNESPSSAWTSAAAWQFTMQSILLKGDAFWIIERRGAEAVGFVPVHPDRVTVERESNGRLRYAFDMDDNTVLVKQQDDVLHFSGLGFDGIRSLNPIRYALRNAAGIASAADKQAADFFSGGTRPDHAIKVPADVRLTAEQKDQLQEAWSNQRGAFVRGKTPVLSGGAEVVNISLSAADAQLLQSREFGVEDVARVFGVPPHMIGKTDKSSSWGSGIEEMSMGFVRYTLRRHLDVIQQEINRKLWPRSLRFFAEFNTDALLDGDSTAQADYFSKALGGPGTQGWMTINEVRRLKNMPPIEGGDKLIMSGTPDPAPAPAAQAKGKKG